MLRHIISSLTHTLYADLAIAVRALTGVGAHGVEAFLAGLTVMHVQFTLIDVCPKHEEELQDIILMHIYNLKPHE